jgi:hypothetical protein
MTATLSCRAVEELNEMGPVDYVGLLSEDDVDEAAGALEPGTSARAARGQLVASGRIPVQAVLAALDAAEAA